jgi:hypothetical protein
VEGEWAAMTMWNGMVSEEEVAEAAAVLVATRSKTYSMTNLLLLLLRWLE